MFGSFFQFTSQQRSGVFLLLTIMVVVQAIYFYADFSDFESDTFEKQEWLAFQKEIDSLKKIKKESSLIRQTYNPNFITDFRGYTLGMTTGQIDRLLAFRRTNKYVNSAKAFQDITQISDSLLEVLSSQFEFSNRINKKENKKVKHTVIIDINSATKEDLMKIYGIGTGLSDRILKQRNTFGAFVDMEQLNDIWGLSPEVIGNLNKKFKIIEHPNVKRININTASIQELVGFPYFRYTLAKEIVTYRSMNNGISGIGDLVRINGFPLDKIKIIALYLEL